MGLFSNPLGYAGYPPDVQADAQVVNSTVRAATAAEAAAGTLTNVYVSPATADSATALDFASPPVLGFGSTTPRPVHATTLGVGGLTTIADAQNIVVGSTTGTKIGTATTQKLGFFNATPIVQLPNTTDLRQGLIDLGFLATGGASPLNLNGGDLTAANVNATGINTNVAAAQLSLSGTTIDATGSDAAVSMNFTTKGTGSIVYSQSKSGVDQNIQITNSDNTAASSPAGLQIAVGGATNTGDPYINFLVSGAGVYTMGIDNSASDDFVLAASTALGTSDIMSISSVGAVIHAGAITSTLGDITATNGNLVLAAAGNKLNIHASTAASDSVGVSAVLDGASPSQLVVSTTAVTSSSIILLSYNTAGGTQGSLSVGTIVNGTSFQIKSSANGDTSTVNYMIIN